MKNKITILLFGTLFLNTNINAQVSTGAGGASSISANNPTTNTNLGIGVNTPKAKLEIEGFPTTNKTYTFLDYNDSYDKSVLLNIGTVRTAAGARLLTFCDVPPSNIRPNGTAMFAIEDRNDANRFRHSATTNGASNFTLSDKTQTAVLNMYEDGINAFFDFPKSGTYLTIGGIAVWPIAHNFWVKTGSAKFDNNVFIDKSLCIGTANFTDGSETYKLSVKGKVRAEEVKVYNTWADYVFADNYDLKPLTKVEEYIAQNGHLPNVPSAKEITVNGLALGEMAKIQQEKIEELTLYLIQQNKEIEELKSQMKLLLASQKK